MEPVKPHVMLEQINDLPNLMTSKTKIFAEQVRLALSPEQAQLLRRVYLVGDGDSYHAACSAEMAFDTIAGVPCEPVSGQRFLDYKSTWLPVQERHDVLVIGISASGSTRRIVQSIKAAREAGAFTLALTGKPNSVVTQVADRAVCVEVPFIGPSPGIRTFNATLMGLYLTAIQIGKDTGSLRDNHASSLREEIIGLAEVIQATALETDKWAKDAARAYQDASIMMFLGSGPSYGTAIFSAAKVIEAAGVFAMGQDLEEWSHVEFFAYPNDMPVTVIAPSGQSYWRAVETAEMAKSYGHRLIVVASRDDGQASTYGDYVFPVVGHVREEFSPLVYHIGADLFSCYLTQNLNRMLFQSDNTNFQKLNSGYQSRDRIRN